MSEDAETIRRQLAVVSQAFQEQLPIRGAEIAHVWERVTRQTDTPAPLDSLYRLTHNLAGAGGTFGFPRITALARLVAEPLRNTLKKGAGALSRHEVALLEQPLELLIELCLHPTPETDPIAGVNLVHIVPARYPLYYLYGASVAELEPLAEALRKSGQSVCLMDNYDDLKQAVLANSPEEVVLLTDLAAVDRDIIADLDFPQRPLLIALAEQDDFERRLSAVRLGMDGFFVQPVDPGQLIDYVDLHRPQEHKRAFRVLIVDDDQRQAEYASIVLQRAGMVTRVVHDPARLLGCLDDFNPDLFLLDVYLPQCSGIELAGVIRQLAGYAAVPIIFLSVESEQAAKLSALQSGAVAFLTKPVFPRDLVSTVDAVLQRNWRLSVD